MFNPAEYHCIDDEMRALLPPDRLERFREFFTARVEGSYYIDAISVDDGYRSMGIGNHLLQKTKDKARDEGFSILSLLVYADNHRAQKFY